MKWKIAACIALTVTLQSQLRHIWLPLVNIDLPLVFVVYFALRRNVVQALIIGGIAGLATDALSSGLLGANGFSKTLTAYFIAVLATRVMLDNQLVRIPVLAGAVIFNASIYVVLHRLFGQPPAAPFVETVAFSLIGTTTVGTILFYLLDTFFSDRVRQRRQFAFRRRIARRGARQRKF